MNIDEEDVVIKFIHKKMSENMLEFYRKKILSNGSESTKRDKEFLSGLTIQQKNQLIEFIELFFNEAFASFFVTLEGERVNEEDKIDLFFRGKNLEFLDDSVYSYLEQVYPSMFKGDV